MNLIDLLPKEDKALMEKYIHLYGIGEKDFIGLDEYLKYWAESKKKLYKLLGNQFQLEIPYSYEKPYAEMRTRFSALLSHPFLITLCNALTDKVFQNEELEKFLWDFCYREVYLNDKISKSIKFKPKENVKEIRLQEGMKPVRALQRIAKAYPELFSTEVFEDFRIKHSLCLNDKFVKGALVLSIHPFDFITMSDNASDWSSCMSWTNEGCYHLGTVEMMNSNNVIVAYIKSSSCPYNFSKGEEDHNLVWNNKKWRQLIYITKDIIVSGKAYPYSNKEVSFMALEELKKLAKQNLSWTYMFGPEKYSDMIHINSMEAMENNRRWLYTGQTFKHNILFDTRGMYNDMLNDSCTNYWCYRNKVPKMRIVSVSGKAPCACCGDDALYESECPEDYNDRWNNPERIVCSDCFEDGECYICDSFVGRNSLIQVNETKLCSSCASTYLKKCPCCGKPFVLSRYEKSNMPGIQISEMVYYGDYSYCNQDYYEHFDDCRSAFDNHIKPYPNMNVIPAFMCQDCLHKDLKNPNGLFVEKLLEKPPAYPTWMMKNMNKIITKRIYTEEEISNHPELSKMLMVNLEPYNME